jgi:hypothetical protein
MPAGPELRIMVEMGTGTLPVLSSFELVLCELKAKGRFITHHLTAIICHLRIQIGSATDRCLSVRPSGARCL